MSIDIVYKERLNKYSFNVACVKKYGDSYKIQWQNCVVNKGVQIEKKSRGSNEKKLDCNMRRAKNTIKEYSLCNDWQFFVTFTLDKKMMDRYDLGTYNKKLNQYIANLNRSREDKIKFLLIPEKHKDGAWHMHGFLKGLREEEYRREKENNRKRDVYHWIGYNQRFGFDDMEKIESIEKASSYITKYVTKDMMLSVSECNAKSYYCSRGLNRSVVVAKGTVSAKYNPSYIKYSNETNEPIYSELWLGPVTEEYALSFINDNMISNRWQYVDDCPFVDL